MTTADEVPRTPAEVLADDIAAANEVRREAYQAAEASYGQAAHEIHLAEAEALERAGEAYDQARQAAEDDYQRARSAAILAYNQASGHDQQAGG